jgi:hypothetical protein
MPTCDWDSEVLRDISRWFILLANTHCPHAAVSWVDGVQANAAISVNKNALKTVQKTQPQTRQDCPAVLCSRMCFYKKLDVMLIFCKIILLHDLTARKRH